MSVEIILELNHSKFYTIFKTKLTVTYINKNIFKLILTLPLLEHTRFILFVSNARRVRRSCTSLSSCLVNFGILDNITVYSC